MSKKKMNKKEKEEMFNTMAVQEVYPVTGDIMDWVGLAKDKGYITDEEYKKHRDNLIDIVLIFQVRSKYGKKDAA